MYNHDLFTSESVCAGHPDKLCDRISDSILDAVLAQDPHGRVAVETVATAGRLIICGEVAYEGKVDYATVAREQIKRLGYVHPELHFTAEAQIDVLVHEQSPEISRGVTGKKGAGDQGMMFGFACRETPQLMPLPITLAHEIAAAIDLARESKSLPYLLPDGKCQVTVRYENGKPVEVTKVVVAVPHLKTVELSQVAQDVFDHIVVPVLARYGFSLDMRNLTVNGTGVWHFSGPAADTGLTGRKIVVDGYGGYARVGGGAFSGKDPSKVDRSGAYAARYIAKNLVAAGLAERAEVSLAYCIGQPQPVMKNIEAFGSETRPLKELEKFADSLLDCSVEGIIDGLDLRRPLYAETAAYGHFGRPDFPWEKCVPNAAV